MADYFLSSASGAGGAGNGSSWANAYLTMAALIARPITTGDRIWVGDDHAENTAAAVTLTFPGNIGFPNFIYCVDHTVASPTSANLKTGTAIGGVIQTNTGVATITLNGTFYMYGVYFLAGGTSPIISCNSSNNATQAFENCTFAFNSSSAQTFFGAGGSGFGLFTNCTLKFSILAGFMSPRATTHWKGGAIDTSAIVPTQLFTGNAAGSKCVMEDLDLSAFGAGKTLLGVIAAGSSPYALTLRRCKLSASVTTFVAGSVGPMQNISVDFQQCDSGAGYYRNDHYNGSGSQVTLGTVYRTGGASDGVTPISWRVTTSGVCWWVMPFWTQPIVIWNTVVGTVNITLEALADPRDYPTIIPANDHTYFEAEYFGNASSTQGKYSHNTKSNNLATGTAVTASTAAWSAPARANSTAYVLGAFISVASNPGRLFVCTTAGTTAASEPGAFAVATDGTTGIIDNTARFGCMWRYKLTLAITTTAAGYIYVTPKYGNRANAIGFILDPLITLS